MLRRYTEHHETFTGGPFDGVLARLKPGTRSWELRTGPRRGYPAGVARYERDDAGQIMFVGMKSR